MDYFKSNKVQANLIVESTTGLIFKISSYKLFGDYFLETARIRRDGQLEDYKTKRYQSKDEMFRMRDLAAQYLSTKGIW